MNSYTKVAKAVFTFEGENPNDQYETTVIFYKDSLWLVATWISNTEQNMRIPDRIVPLALFDPHSSHGAYLELKRSVPKALLTADCPPQLLKQFDAEILSVPVDSHQFVSSFH